MNLRDHNILVFDCEIQNPVDGKIIGWRDYDKMGHAVSASYNFKTNDYKIYFNDNATDLIDDINRADMISGFNIKGFDLPLLNAIFGSRRPFRDDLVIYDPLEHSRQAVGNQFAKGLRLQNHLEGTFGTADLLKNGDGADAPALFLAGRYGELCSYVLRDVKTEAALFEHIWNHGWVKTPAHGQRNVRSPKEMLPMQFELGF